MKKFFWAVALFAAATFVGCESSEENDDNGAEEYAYTLQVSPTTVAKGETVTFTVVGDDADQCKWQACYESTTIEGYASCWAPADFPMEKEITLDAGVYEIHATSWETDEEYHSSTVTLTVTEE